MSWQNRVVWQEGMFLRAQHFQQQDRHAAYALQARCAPLISHAWGVTEMAVDRDLLAAGRVAISSASGVMEDGTPFSIPQSADPPLPIDLPDGVRNNTILYLALPLYQDGRPEVALSEDGPDAIRARYRLRNFDAFDTHSDSTIAADISVARPRLRLLLETDDLAGFSTLGVTRIVEMQADRRVILDERFIPPCLKISASAVLSNLAAELVGMIGQRADALAARLGQPGPRVSPMSGTSFYCRR